MLYDLAKNSFILQKLAIRLLSSIHPSIEHNIAKIEMLKKALFYCELERIEGAYFEFGVFEGTSLLAAAELHRRLNFTVVRNYYGFDSFDEGFKYFSSEDAHPFFKAGDFSSSYEKTLKRFRKHQNVKLIKGFFEHSLSDSPATEISDKCAIAFIDCDLKSPASVALEYLVPRLQEGSVLIVDDYFAYKGKPTLGTCGAVNDFLERNDRIKLRPFNSYGHGGQSFIVYEVGHRQ